LLLLSTLPIAVSAASKATFTNFELGDLSAEVCPSTTSPCQNGAAEPAIRADKFGNFFGASENGLTSGTEAWKSVDGGRHYIHLPSPNIVSSTGAEGDISPAGGDVDLATASERNSLGNYNVCVSCRGGDVTVSTSSDNGQTWKVNAGAGTTPADDREWIASDGASKVCISYVSAAVIILSPLGLHVNCSYDAGTTFTQVGDAITPGNLDSRLGFKIGNMAIDQNSNTSDPGRNNDIIYQTYASGTAADAINPNPTGYHVVYMAVSQDGGKTFVDHVVYANPDVTADYAHQFVNVSVDRAGNVYAFYSDDHNLYYSFSKNHGQTWSGPYQINKSPSNTAIFPWSVAGDAGKVDVVWYGTSYYGPEHPDNYPATAQWYVYFAQNLSATVPGSGFSQVQVTPTLVHYGAVCEGGVGCTGNRDLYDDFGVAASPTTGMASIIYSDDQYQEYNHTSRCTATQNNTGSCDHTNIATQTSGQRIFK